MSTLEKYESILNAFILYIQNADLNNVCNIEHYIYIKKKTSNYHHTKKETENKTINYHIMIIRSFMKFLYNKRHINEIFYNKFFNEKVILKVPIKTIKQLDWKELNRIIANVSEKHGLMIETLAHTGMRKQELLSLKVEDIENDMIKITSKYDNERYVFLEPYIYNKLKIFVGDRKCGYVFISNRGTKYSHDLLNKILNKYNISVHSLRHLFASRMSQKNIPVSMLQVILGHKDIRTTMGYISHSKENIKDAINKADIRN